jgi:histidyl-tRNA synthetase
LLAESLRDAGISTIVHAGTGSFKAQFKRADTSGAAIAVILGDDELAAGAASVKMLRSQSSSEPAGQQQVSLDNLVTFLKEKVK